MYNSSVATGGGAQRARPPLTVDRHGHRIRANPRRFLGGGVGVVTALPQTSELMGRGPAALPLLRNPTPRIGPLCHVTGVPPTLKSWLRH